MSRQQKKGLLSKPIIKHIAIAICAAFISIGVVTLLLDIFTRSGQIRIVPDFTGMTVEEATKAGSFAKLRIEINDSLYVPSMEGGVILEQQPSAGAEVKNGRRIFVTTNAHAQRMVTIPYVTGYSLRQAKNNLEVAGLTIAKLVYTTDIATNNVIDQHYGNEVITEQSNIQAPVGSGITLIVGRQTDYPPQKVPLVVGYTFAEARSRLWEAGFNIGKTEFDNGVTKHNAQGAKISYQSPSVASLQELGSNVSLIVTFDEKKVADGVAESQAILKELAKAAAIEDSIANMLLQNVDITE